MLLPSRAQGRSDDRAGVAGALSSAIPRTAAPIRRGRSLRVSIAVGPCNTSGMAVRKLLRSIIPAAVTLGGIFGLIVDAPSVFGFAGSLGRALLEWVGSMLTQDLGYWLLIVLGLLSLAWVHFGERIRATWSGLWLNIGMGNGFESDHTSSAVPAPQAPAPMSTTSELEDLRAQLRTIDKNIVSNNEQALHLERDLSFALDALVSALGQNMLSVWLEFVPDVEDTFDPQSVTAKWLDQQIEKADDYIIRVRRSLYGTQWHDEFRLRLQQAAAEAERQIKAMPLDRVPPGMDRLDLLPYGIAVTQCNWTVNFLRQQKHEEAEKLGCHIRRLQRQMAQRRQAST